MSNNKCSRPYCRIRSTITEMRAYCLYLAGKRCSYGQFSLHRDCIAHWLHVHFAPLLLQNPSIIFFSRWSLLAPSIPFSVVPCMSRFHSCPGPLFKIGYLSSPIMPISSTTHSSITSSFSITSTSKTPYLAMDERAPGKETSICLSLCIMQ